jgi:hypothetical protein
LEKQSSQQVVLLSDVVNNTPRGILFNTITTSLQGVHVDATVQSVDALTIFVNKLKQNPNVLTVSIDKIENKIQDSKITVGITAKLRTAPTIKK